MINKVLMSGYNDSGLFPAAAVIPSFSKGLDKDSLRKRASIFENEYDKFERKPNTTYIHLISVAAGEHYGPNSRADFYNGDSYEHTVPHPEKGCPRVVVLDGGINKYHNTFMKHGGVYTEHFSDQDGAKSQGYIVAAKVNPEMHRGELIIGVNSPEWADDIHKLESGKPLKFSIGALTASDRCSYCGHVAHTEDDHCDHYKKNRGMITDDGSQIYVITDKCMYHDISRVKSPAEKIAFSIKKVASANDDFTLWRANTPSIDTVRGMIKTASGLKRFDTLAKLAAISKKLTAYAKGEKSLVDENFVKAFKAKDKMAKEAACDGSKELRSFLDFADHDQILTGLKANKCVLSPSEFINLMMSDEDQKACHICHEDVESRIPEIFNTLLHSDDIDELCEDNTYEKNECCTPILIDRIKGSGLMKMDMGSILSDILGGFCPDCDLQKPNKTIIIKISNPSNSISDILAKDYASYMMSAASDLRPEEMVMSLLGRFI